MPFPTLQTKLFKFSELNIGQQEVFVLKITEDLIEEFADFSGDRNPLHISEEQASKSIFKRRVAHGFLVSSFFSSFYANLLPGKGSILLAQNLKYLNPVFINDEVTYKVIISQIEKKKKTVELDISCTTNKKVIEGRASILLVNL